MTLAKERRAFDRSNHRLRRARRLYAFLVRRWVERVRDPVAYRERAYRCARRGMEAGLWKTRVERDAVFGILGQWRRYDRMGWWAWRGADQRRTIALDWERGFRAWLEERRKKKA